jgi:small GTP-binding protein
MDTEAHRDALLGVLDELCSVTDDGGQRAAVAELVRRLREDRLRVLVVGEAKRGKSTLINALLARTVLPMGVTPLTALATTVTYGVPEGVEARFWDGHRQPYPPEKLPDLVTESGNPGNLRGITSVVVRLEAPLLAAGIELVDTPGTGSVYGHNTAAARQALGAMDAAVFVLTADPPVSASELELLTEVDAASVATFVLLNKADRLDAAEREQALAFTADTVARRLGHTVRIYPCSARTALSGAADPGLAAFEAEFTRYLAAARASDLERSVAVRAGAVAGALLDAIALTLRADQLHLDEDAGRIAAFRDRLDALAERHRDAEDRAQAGARHLLETLNTCAGEQAAALAPEVAARLEAALAAVPGGASWQQLQRAGLDAITAAATDGAERWRQAQAEVLQAGMADLGARASAALERDLAAVREAARALLGVELNLAPAGVSLAADPRFHYAPAAPENPTQALAAAVRGRLPGRLGRRRVAAHLHALVAEVVDRQVGRARADLQQRLEATSRELSFALAEQYRGYGAHLSDALGAAEQLRTLTRAQAGERRAQLAARNSQIAALQRRITALAEHTAAPVPDPL